MSAPEAIARLTRSRQRRVPASIVQTSTNLPASCGDCEASKVPVSRTAEEDAIAHRLDQPHELCDAVLRPGRVAFGIEHEHSRPVRRRPNDLDRLPQCRQLRTAPGPVVSHEEILAVKEEVDLDTRDAFGVALAKAAKRVLPMTTAPGSSMRLELHDASMSGTDERKRVRVGENALRDQASRSPLCGSKRWSRSGTKRRPILSPILPP